jgi:hypothetical protein
MSDAMVDTVNKVLAYGALGFGVAGVLAPTALRKSYGMSVEGPELTYLGRMWGTRNVVLGALSLGASTEEERKRYAMVTIGMNVLDSLTAATTDGLPGSTRVMGALTSAGFAAAGVYVVSNS